MPRTIALSESAVCVFRLRNLLGARFQITQDRMDGFRELVAAGIMEPAEGDFRFVEDDKARRGAILREAELHLLSLLPHLPDRIELSDEARELLRTCIAGPSPDGDETNRPAYRELVNAGIMMSVGTFSKGDDCVFRFTYRGYERRFEFAEMSCAKETA